MASEATLFISEPGFDPGTCGLWAHHASAAPLWFVGNVFVNYILYYYLYFISFFANLCTLYFIKNIMHSNVRALLTKLQNHHCSKFQRNGLSNEICIHSRFLHKEIRVIIKIINKKYIYIYIYLYIHITKYFINSSCLQVLLRE